MKVLAAGTFDMFHEGHKSFLEQAFSLGSELHVIIARDVSVQNIKNKKPIHSENERKKNIEQSDFVHTAYLGDESDFMKIPLNIQPDIIAIGYDQKIPKKLTETFHHIPIVRMKAYKPEKYKSSFFRNNDGNTA